mmetsp:Transcript_1486/g.2934  ORF Transcript_1486/g.2934 Transcript_1486/m.2934 type:complete len:215 (+) Transcript_1486:1110-1754(+)
MGVVPCVVVNKGSLVCHSSHLITIIPPRHDLGMAVSVVIKPIVGFSEIVKQYAASIGSARRKDNRRRRVCSISCPSTVHGVDAAKNSQDQDAHQWSLENNVILFLFVLFFIALCISKSFFLSIPLFSLLLSLCSVHFFLYLSRSFAKIKEEFSESCRYANSTHKAHSRCQYKHQTNHDSSKVDCQSEVENCKNAGFVHFPVGLQLVEGYRRPGK